MRNKGSAPEVRWNCRPLTQIAAAFLGMGLQINYKDLIKDGANTSRFWSNPEMWDKTRW